MSNRRAAFPARLDHGAARLQQPTTAGGGTRVASAALPGVRGLGLDSSAVRARMVERLAAQGLGDAAVLAVLGRVERHRFVDSALAAQAYEDTSLPIGFAQTISKPSVIARMLSLLRAAPGAGGRLTRVLEIGTGCGYQAALLAHLAHEVYSVERIRGLYERALTNLRPLRLPNLHLILADGMLGFAQGAPYAGIISAAGAEAVPAAWIEQLAIGGRLVAPVAGGGGTQALVVIDRHAHGIERSVLEPVHFVPLKSGLA